MTVRFDGHYTALPPSSIEDLWLFPKRNQLVGLDYEPLPGGFIPEVPYWLIQRFTRKGDVVYDPMAGAMVTHRVARLLERNPISVDLTVRGDKTVDPVYSELIQADGTEHDPGPADLIIWHPPYKGVIKFSDNSQDLSVMNGEAFWEAVKASLHTFDGILRRNRFCCIVIGNVYEEGQIEPLALHIITLVQQHLNLGWMLKGLVVKDIRGNNQRGAGLQRYRAVHLMDSFVFRYEYILVFKKE